MAAGVAVRTRWAVAAVSVLVLTGCADGPVAATPAPALAAPAADVRGPIPGVAMTQGETYRLGDVLPDVLDVDITVPGPGLYAFPGPQNAYLAGNAAATVPVVSFVNADETFLELDPLRIGSGAFTGESGQLTNPRGDDLLARLAALPFLEVTASARPLTVGGLPATAVDVRVPELPAGTQECEPGLPCASLLLAGGGGQLVLAGQELRLAQLALPAGRILIVQNLQDPRAQGVLDSARFVERVLPGELSGARPIPYSVAALDPDTTFGTVLPGIGVGVRFATGDLPVIGYSIINAHVSVISADLPADLQDRAVGPGGYTASTEELYGYVAPTSELLVPEPGVDPRAIGASAFERSTGGPSLVDLVTAQPWAEVVTPVADSTVGGLPARSVEVRLRPETGSVPCTIGLPEQGSCAVLVYQRSHPSIWLLSERVLRISDVRVGDAALSVITGVGEGGRAFADSLRLVEVT